MSIICLKKIIVKPRTNKKLNQSNAVKSSFILRALIQKWRQKGGLSGSTDMSQINKLLIIQIIY